MKTLVFRRDLFADRIKVILQKLESETDKKLKSLMTAEAKSKVDGIDAISKKFHDVVKITSNDGSKLPDFPEEIYTAVMKRVVAVEAPKISGGVFNQGAIIQQLGAYIADLLDTKSETIKVGKTTYILSNPIGSTVSAVTVTVKGNENVKYTFSWNDTDKAKKSLNNYMESLQEFEKEQLLSVFFALLKDAKKASGVLKDLSSLWSKGLLSGKALDYASKMKGFEFFRVLSTYKKMYGESVFTLITGVVEEIKPLLEIYANTQTPNKKAKKLLDAYSTAVGSVEGFIAWTEEIFSDNKKAIKNITEKYNSLLEKSINLAETVTNYEGSDESLIATLDKKSSVYQNFIVACSALETELGQSNSSFDSLLEDYTTYNITTDAHKETITTNNAVVKGTNENDTLNIQSHDVKVYGGKGDDNFIASNRNITLIGEQGKDHFLLRDVANKNYVDAGADDDTILSYGNNNTINGGSGNDSILVSVYEDFGTKNEIRGGEGQDTLSVTAVIESTVLGEADNDFIYISEEANNNTIIGGTGNDTIMLEDADRNFIGYSTGDGNDTVWGFDSNDTLYIAEGDFSKSTIGTDVMVSVSDGSILLKDAAGKDSNVKKPLTFDDLFKDMQRNKVIFGTQQDDTIHNTVSGATIEAGDGADTTYNGNYWNAGGNSVSIDGGADNDYIYSNGSDVTIDGGDGDNRIYNECLTQYNSETSIKKTLSSPDNAVLNGGDGNDSIWNDGSNAIITSGDGNNYVDNNGDSVTIHTGLENDKIYNDGFNVTIAGDDGNDYIFNRGSDVIIDGESGADDITNEGGLNISINSGDGDDTISNDTYLVWNSETQNHDETITPDNVTIDSGAGNDEISNNGKYVSILGSTGNDLIYNGGVSSTIDSGDGDDTIRNWNGSNVSIMSSKGDDSIYNHGTNVTIDTGTGNDSVSNEGSNVTINATANNDDDTIYNSGDSVTVNCGDGNDSIQNGTYYGSNFTPRGDNVIVNGGNGNDSIRNTSDFVTINSGNGNDSIINYSSKSFVINGEDGNDFISNNTNGIWNSETRKIEAVSADNSTIDGGKGDDSINNSLCSDVSISGGEGNDYIWNNSINVSINGGNGNDKIISSSNSTIDGAAGDDSINNSGSNVSINGGDGNDTVYSYGANNSINAGAGNDSIYNTGYGSLTVVDGDDAADYIYNWSYSVSINGNEGSDSIINGWGYAVSINGGDDNDYICNGDSLSGGDGDSVTINGGAGNDEIYNYKGDNVSISGGLGDDKIFLGTNLKNFIQYSSGDGNDIIYGFRSDETLSISGDSYSTQVSGSDIIVSVGDGAITLSGAASMSVNIVGKTVDDTLVTVDDNTASPLTISSTVKNVNASTRTTAVKITGNALANTISGGSKNDSLYGGANGDSIIGNAGNDKLYGEAGNDTLRGNKGNDTLTGGDGKDLFLCGAGNDVIVDYETGDRISLASAITKTTVSGSDVVFTMGSNSLTVKNAAGKSLSMINSKGKSYSTVVGSTSASTLTVTNSTNSPVTVNSSIEVIDASTRTKAIQITGNKLANTIRGGNKNDTLYGGAGKDSLIGGKGNDILYGQAGNDTLRGKDGNDTLTGGDGKDLFLCGAGKEVITDYETGDRISLASAITKTTLSGSDVVFTMGSNSLTVKNAKGKTLKMINSTGKSYSTVVGSLETLTLTDSDSSPVTVNSSVEVIDAASRTVAVSIKGNGLDNTIIGGSGNDSLYGRAGNDSLVGGKGNDKLYGSNGDDILVGGAGNDSLWGDAGDDSLYGGSGNDTFIYKTNEGTDRIFDYQSGDMIKLLKSDGSAGGKFKKSSYSKGTLTLTIKDGGSVIFENVTTSTTFNINSKTYTISGSKLK